MMKLRTRNQRLAAVCVIAWIAIARSIASSESLRLAVAQRDDTIDTCIKYMSGATVAHCESYAASKYDEALQNFWFLFASYAILPITFAALLTILFRWILRGARS